MSALPLHHWGSNNWNINQNIARCKYFLKSKGSDFAKKKSTKQKYDLKNRSKFIWWLTDGQSAVLFGRNGRGLINEQNKCHNQILPMSYVMGIDNFMDHRFVCVVQLFRVNASVSFICVSPDFHLVNNLIFAMSI